jgi:hypothetical protein
LKIKNIFESIKSPYYKNEKLTYLREYFVVGILYIISTILFTYPVAFKLTTDIPGTGADSFQWMRILWYTKTAVQQTNLTKLTHDSLLFYPNGIESMPFQSAFNQIMYLLLSPFLELHVIYTILWLLTFVIGAIGAYLLVKYLTGNQSAAFLAGIVFAFSPFHFSRALYFFGAASVQWIPFCALFLIKTAKEGGIKNPVLAGIFFILVAMSDLQYMIFMGIFAGLLFLYEAYLKLISRTNYFNSATEMLKKYSLFAAVSFLGLLPLTINEIAVSLSGKNYLKANIREIPGLSNDLMSFFLPSHLNPFLGRFTTDFYSNIPSWFAEKVNFIGYVVLALSLFTCFRLRKNPEVKFWILVTLFFSIISLGPILHINGVYSFTAFKTYIALPYVVMYDIVPFLDNCRTVGRFFVVATLGFSVLAGYGLSDLFKYKPEKKVLIGAVVSSLIILEFLCIPYPTVQASVPAFYDKISNDQENYGLLEIPLNHNAGYMNFEYLYYQTVHHKPLVGGYAARYPANIRSFQKYTPFIRELNFYPAPQEDILPDVTQIGSSVLRLNNIRYVIIHTNELSDQQINYVNKLLKETLKTVPDVYPEDKLIVYQVPDVTPAPYVVLNNGWSTVEKQNGVPTRWISNNASITVNSDRPQNTTLKFKALSLYYPVTLEIFNGKTLQSKQIINTNSTAIYTPVNLEKGENHILLQVTEAAKMLDNSSNSESRDSQKPNVAIQEIRFVE